MADGIHNFASCSWEGIGWFTFLVVKYRPFMLVVVKWVWDWNGSVAPKQYWGILKCYMSLKLHKNESYLPLWWGGGEEELSRRLIG